LVVIGIDVSIELFCLRRDTFFQQLKKVSKKSRHCAWRVLIVFSVFMGGGHPYQPVQFPPCHVFHTSLPHPPITSTPTAQRPTPPVGGIEVLDMI